MASRDSWIDPDEVSGLAGEIFPEGKKPPSEDDDYTPLPLLDDDEVSAANEVVDKEKVASEEGDEAETGKAERIAEQLRTIRARAVRSGLLIGMEPQTQEQPDGEDELGVAEHAEVFVPEPFVLPNGRLVEQVRCLVDWLAAGSDQVFVLDELGDELVRGDVPAGLRSGAVRLAQSWERSQRWLRDENQAADAPLACAALAGGMVLSVVGVRCTAGFYCAALVDKRMIAATHAARVREALFLVFG